jgi:hypothetical protein
MNTREKRPEATVADGAPPPRRAPAFGILETTTRSPISIAHF